VNGFCIAGNQPDCTTDSQCGDGRKCVQGKCEDVVVQPDCTKDEECGEGFKCAEGQCVGGTTEKCETDEDCEEGFECKDQACVEIEPVPECDEDSDCESDNCDEETGKCGDIIVPVDCESDADCKDDNPCTIDTCVDAKCSNEFKAGAGCCNTAQDCPNVSCNKTSCEGQQCKYTAVEDCCTLDGECEDGNILTVDKCVEYECQHNMPDCVNDGECDDSNPCTLDYCQNAECKHTPDAGAACCTSDKDCDDGKLTTKDICISNQCIHVGSTPCDDLQDCVDSNPCTQESCSAGLCTDAPVESAECTCISDADCFGTKGSTCTIFQTGPLSLGAYCANPHGPKKGGEPCSINAECKSDFCVLLEDGSICFGGCKSDVDCSGGTACGQINFGLPGDNTVEVPACVPSSQPCTGDAQCKPGDVCLPMATPAQPDTIVTACGDGGVGTKEAGETCTGDTECESHFCFDLFEKSKSVCWAACKTDADCSNGLKCYPNILYFAFDHGTPTEEDDSYFGVSGCTENLGSYQPCLADATCPGNEFCYPYPNQFMDGLDPRCVSSFSGGMLNAGASCAQDSQCKSNDCENPGSGGICFGLCQQTSQCAGNTDCVPIDITIKKATVQLHVCL